MVEQIKSFSIKIINSDVRKIKQYLEKEGFSNGLKSNLYL